MVKMNLYFSLFIALLGCLIQTQAAVYDKKWAWHPHPHYYYPWRPLIPHLRPHPIPPKAIKCLRDFGIERLCTRALAYSYYTGKLDLAHECCEAVANMTDDCVYPVFSRYKNPDFFPLLKKHCSKKVAKPPSTSPVVGQPKPQPPSGSPPVVGDPQPPSEEPQPPVAGEPQPPSEEPQPPSGEPQPPVGGEPQPPSEQPQPPFVEEPQPPSEAPSPSFEGWF